jgi:putative membrane protein
MLRTMAILADAASSTEAANQTFRERHPMAVENLLGAVVFAAIGIVVFLVVFWGIVKVSPFSVRKEIEEDQNTSLAIIIGAVMIGIAIIIAAAINGG